MLSSISTISVRPSDAVTVIVPWLTANRRDTCFPSVSWKLIFSLMLHFYGAPWADHPLEPVDETYLPTSAHGPSLAVGAGQSP